MMMEDKITQIDHIYRNLKLETPNESHLPTHASVLLLLTCFAKENFKIFELGSGIGHVSLVLGKIYPKSQIIGIEIQKKLYECSLKNKNANQSTNVEFYNLSVKNIKEKFNTEVADYLIFNPPHYFDGIKNKLEDRRTARSSENLEILDNFLYASKYLLKNKSLGSLVIHPYILSDTVVLLEKNHLKAQHIYVAYGDKKYDAQLVSIVFRKNGGRNLIIHSPIFFSDWKKLNNH